MWSHALAYDGVWLVLVLSLFTALYLGLRRHSEVIGQLVFSAWFIIQGFNGWTAVVHNLWIRIGWYVGGI